MPELKLESGKRTTLNLLVGDEVVSIENVTVSDWADGGNITGGEAEEVMENSEFGMQNSELNAKSAIPNSEFIIHNSELKKEEDGQ